MKKKIIASLLFAGMAMMATSAFADDNTDSQDGFFLRGQVGVSTAHQDANKTAGAIFGGYRWGIGNGFSLGPELGYEHIGTYNNYLAPGYSLTRKFNTAKLGLDAEYQINDKWYVGADAGLARTYLNAQFHGLAYEHTDRADGWYTGARVGYNLSQNLSVFANVDYTRANVAHDYHFNANTYTVGVQYNFGG
jgi:opacity protein-like surface antigen